MGMYGNYVRISKEDARKIQANEIPIWDVLFSEEPTFFNDPNVSLEIDKFWHIMHYVLSDGSDGATADPLSKAVMGGLVLVEEDCTAFLITDEDVRAICDAFSVVSHDWLKSRFRWGDMIAKQIYLAHEHLGEDEMFNDMLHTTRQIIEFFNKAKAENQFVIFSIS